MIIGLSGTFGSGKDTAAKYLALNYKLLHISTGDMVREEALRTRGSIERPILQEVVTKLRKDYGSSILVDKSLKIYDKQKDEYRGVVITGIRSLGEAEAIKSAGGYLVFLEGNVKIRYSRMLKRNRDQETKLTLDEFIAQEQKEHGDSLGFNFNLLKIKEMSDKIIYNDKNLDSFYTKLDQLIDKIK